jgi:hypothetical protein
VNVPPSYSLTISLFFSVDAFAINARAQLRRKIESELGYFACVLMVGILLRLSIQTACACVYNASNELRGACALK